MHPNEPTMDELVNIRAELYTLEYTRDVEQKIKAVEAQIERRKKEDAEAEQEVAVESEVS